MKGSQVRLEGLSKRFGKVEVLRPLDLEVQPGELVAFLGPSGCGKTTTLLLIAGIYRPSSGGIFFDGKQVNSLHPKDRDIGMVFQSYALYPHLNLFENIAFPLRLKRIAQAEVRRRVDQVAEFLGIAQVLFRRPGQVSGGQQQRAALARALVKEPSLLLLDEPLSNLDARIRLSARSEIRRLQQDLGITSVLVTHDQSEALAMADRVAVFSTGQVQQFATPEELYHRPSNTFVAGFVGDPPMNLLQGTFTEGKFDWDGLTIPVPPGHPGGSGYLGVRPEDIRLGGEIPTRLGIAEPLGREVLLSLDLGEGKTLKVLTPAGTRLAPGASLGLELKGAPLHFFDAEGRRVGS